MLFGEHARVRVRLADDRRPDDRTLIARDGLALSVRVRAQPNLAGALGAWFEAVLADLDPARFDRAWVGMTTTSIAALDSRRLGRCRAALRGAGREPGYFWIGGDDDPDNPGFVILADLSREGAAELGVRIDGDWARARGFDRLAEDFRRWLGSLRVDSGWAGPSLHRGLMDHLSLHLRAYRQAIEARLWTEPGWVPHDDRGVGPAPGRLDHLGWITLLGQAIVESLGDALDAKLPGVERTRTDACTWMQAGPAPALAGDEVLAPLGGLAGVLEPCLELKPRQPIDEWVQGRDAQIKARSKAWMRRHLDPGGYRKRARRELGGR